jgi:hypothetical protein
MGHVSSPVACLGLLNYSTLSYKNTIIGGGNEPKLCVFIFSTNLSEIFPIQRRVERDIFKSVYSFSSKVPFTLVRFYET